MYNRNNPVDKLIRKRLFFSFSWWFLFNYFVLWDRNRTDLTDKIKDSLLFGACHLIKPLTEDKFDLKESSRFRTVESDFVFGFTFYNLLKYFYSSGRSTEENLIASGIASGIWYYLSENPLLNLLNY